MEQAQTTGKIIERSGTTFNSGVNKDLALKDATTVYKVVVGC